MLIEADARLGRQGCYEASVQRGPPLQDAHAQSDAGHGVPPFAGLAAGFPAAKAGRPEV